MAAGVNRLDGDFPCFFTSLGGRTVALLDKIAARLAIMQNIVRRLSPGLDGKRRPPPDEIAMRENEMLREPICKAAFDHILNMFDLLRLQTENDYHQLAMKKINVKTREEQ